MRTHLLVALALLVLASLSGCTSTDVRPPRSSAASTPPARETLLPEGDGFEPQDLVPLTRRAGVVEWKDPLLGDLPARCSMRCMPSFKPSYSVALVCEEGRWSVFTAIEPSARSRARAVNSAGDDGIQRARVPIDEASATAILSVWDWIVRRTRNPKPQIMEWADGTRGEALSAHADGTTYRFDCGEYSGKTWQPKAELTSGIVELGDELRKYSLLDEAARPAQIAHCLELAKKLRAAAEKRPW